MSHAGIHPFAGRSCDGSDSEDAGGFYGQPPCDYSDDDEDFGLGRGQSAAEASVAGVRPAKVGRKKGGPQATDWCVTCGVQPKLRVGTPLPARVTYCIYQEELAKGGYHHWQVFLQTAVRVRRHQVQELLGDPTAHCEPRRQESTAQQAADYCRKLETRVLGGSKYEAGELKGAKVNHMDDIKRDIDAGHTEFHIASTRFAAWSRCERSVAKYIQLRDARIRREWCEPRVELHWGASRTGKTRYVRQWIGDNHDGQAYDKPSGAWWNGYSDQAVILFDDFDGTFPIDTLLQLLDGYGYGMSLQSKGSVVTNKARIFFFTSNKCIDEWYPNASHEQVVALKRRFTLIKEYKIGDVYVKQEPKEVIVID